MFVNRLEDIHWELIITEVSREFRSVLNYSTFEILEPDKLYSVELQNIFFELVNLLNYKNYAYEQSIEQAKKIRDRIDNELEGTALEAND